MKELKIGQKYNGLTIIGDSYIEDKRRKVKCLCECGNITYPRVGAILSGNTKYCGCQRGKSHGKGNYKHGMCYSRLNRIWQKMKQRCNNSNYKEFNYYGGRGITVCEEWQNFKNFADWALNNGYDETLTIDRIDVNKGYFPQNCRWATPKEQSRNKRNNIRIEINGENKCLAEWCEIKGLRYGTVKARLKRGWSNEEALEIVSRKRRTK